MKAVAERSDYVFVRGEASWPIQPGFYLGPLLRRQKIFAALIKDQVDLSRQGILLSFRERLQSGNGCVRIGHSPHRS
jgi:hypothetical protein